METVGGTAQTTSRVRMGALLTATKLPVISEAQVLAERLRGSEMRRICSRRPLTSLGAAQMTECWGPAVSGATS